MRWQWTKLEQLLLQDQHHKESCLWLLLNNRIFTPHICQRVASRKLLKVASIPWWLVVFMLYVRSIPSIIHWISVFVPWHSFVQLSNWLILMQKVDLNVYDLIHGIQKCNDICVVSKIVSIFILSCLDDVLELFICCYKFCCYAWFISRMPCIWNHLFPQQQKKKKILIHQQLPKIIFLN